MGCAASTPTQTQTQYVIQRPPMNQYPGSTFTHTVVTTNVTNAPKIDARRKDSSSSSSSSDSDSEDKKKHLKEKKDVKLSVDILLRFNALSVSISKLERKNVVQRTEEKTRLSIELKLQAAKMNEEYRKLQIKTQKELQDVQNLQNIAHGTNVFRFFQDQAQFDTQMSKEQEEYIQAKTEMEDSHKRLVAIQARQAKLSTEIVGLKVLRDELMKYYKEQDEILDSIFRGEYGSEVEDKLEGELDKQLEKKQRIEIAYQRWRNAQVMVHQASSQLHFAYDRWQSIMRIPYNNQNKMIRLQVAAQTRSYFVAASQNLTAANKILNTVKFPYCDMNEIQTLNKAISYIFIDVQDRGRHTHAGHVYLTTRDRCTMLLQWTNHVITTNIQKDLDESRKVCADLQTKLRAERSRLMKERIEQETGEKVVIDDEPDSGIETDDDTDAADVAAAEAEKIPEAQDLDKQIKEAEKETAQGEEGETVSADNDVKLVPLPLDELAPAPKQDELFGNLETVMAEYDKQREEYVKEMESNKARQQADLQMKLQARRSRKRRMMAQQQELNDLMQKEKDTAAIEIPKEE